MEDFIPDSVLRKEGRQRSATFSHWDSFLQAGDTLVRLLRADREANFLVHIVAGKETVPYFVLAGRTNYARYTPVYVAEMQQLEKKQPLMYRHMIEGEFVVRRSTSNCIPTDQAMEQSINREAKSQGGVIGFALRKGALLRWLMTRHITGEYAEAFKDLCKSSSKDKLHDELGGTRLYRDKKDVKDISHITEYLISHCQDPFNDVPESLVNITTGQVASEKIENSLRNIPEKGRSLLTDSSRNDSEKQLC